MALEATNDCCTSLFLQPLRCMPDGPPQLRIPGVNFQALPGCEHRISCSLQFSFRLGVSTSTSPWPPPLLGWDHQFRGPHDSRGECGFHVVDTAISWWVCPEVPPNHCGHILSKLGISHQATTVDWWLSWGPQTAVSSEMADELDGSGHNVVVRNRKEGGLGYTLTFRTSLRLHVSLGCSRYVFCIARWKYVIRHPWVCKRACSRALGRGCFSEGH